MWDAEQHDTLDVDRFPWSYALEPREVPGWTGIVWMGAGQVKRGQGSLKKEA